MYKNVPNVKSSQTTMRKLGGVMMLNDVEKRKLEVLINAANKGDQEALTKLQTLFGHVSEFEKTNKKERIVSI